MNRETLKRAEEISEEIKRLENEINELPRYIIDKRAYKESGNMYVKRILERYKFKVRIPHGYFQKDLELEMSEEDLQALVELRVKKVKELEKELEEL